MWGEVTTYQMSEEERLAYIEKHPIVPAEKAKSTNFSIPTKEQHENAVVNSKKARQQKPKLIDEIDKEHLHKLFVAGYRIADIAKTFNVTQNQLSYFIRQLRNADPGRWPKR